MSKAVREIYALRPLNDLQLYLLLAVLVLSVAPHFFNLSFWVTGFFTAMAALRLTGLIMQWSTIKRWLIYLCLFMGIVNVVVQYNGAVGKDFGVSLLVSMLGLKLLEIKNYRDAFVILFLTCFVIITQFLYNKDMLLTFYLFSLLVIIFSLFVWLNQVDQQLQAKKFFTTSGLMLLQSIPVMIVLFIFFPRLDNPLWGFDQETGLAVTGISGEITPGSVSRLSQSSATAFRIRFDDPDKIPANEKRYWRGPVLTNTDGRSWSAEKKPRSATVQLLPEGDPVDYQLTIEPSQQHWLFALDIPVSLPVGSYITQNYSVRSKDKISRRKTFKLQSYTDYRTPNLNDTQKLAALQLPDNISSRMKDFVQQQRSLYPGDAEYAAALLAFFNQEEFVYTLTPPSLGDNPADEFLFETRRGFCEHFATSYVLLLRQAGIPARVVAGYQGGEWNPAGNHLIIRQSDAHAWVEAWMENRGWVRIDPTAAVAPERIERSFDPDIQQADAPIMFRVSSDGMFGVLFKQAAWMADALDLNWHRWVVGFNRERQSDFLKMNGLDFLKGYKLALAAVVGAFVMILLMVWISRHRNKPNPDLAKRYWDRFCRKLQKQGVECRQIDGPLAVAAKARKTLPQRAASIELITRLYIRVRYGREDRQELNQQLKKLIQQF